MILYGSNLGNSDRHNCIQLPVVVLGKGGGFKGNQHISAATDTPLANVLVTIAQRAGVTARTLSVMPLAPSARRKTMARWGIAVTLVAAALWATASATASNCG